MTNERDHRAGELQPISIRAAENQALRHLCRARENAVGVRQHPARPSAILSAGGSSHSNSSNYFICCIVGSDAWSDRLKALIWLVVSLRILIFKAKTTRQCRQRQEPTEATPGAVRCRV